MPGKVMVRFKNGTTAEAVAALLQSLGLVAKGTMSKRRDIAVNVPRGAEDAWVKKFKAMDAVEDAGRDYIAHTCNPR